MANDNEFWDPGLFEELPEMPVLVIKQAASGLAPLTKGLVEAVVRTGEIEKGWIPYFLIVQAPALKYSRSICAFRHGVTKPYPIYADDLTGSFLLKHFSREKAIAEKEGIGLTEALKRAIESQKPAGEEITNEPDLRDFLQKLLRSHAVTEIIKGLMAALIQSADQTIPEAA